MSLTITGKVFFSSGIIGIIFILLTFSELRSYVPLVDWSRGWDLNWIVGLFVVINILAFISSTLLYPRNGFFEDGTDFSFSDQDTVDEDIITCPKCDGNVNIPSDTRIDGIVECPSCFAYLVKTSTGFDLWRDYNSDD